VLLWSGSRHRDRPRNPRQLRLRLPQRPALDAPRQSGLGMTSRRDAEAQGLFAFVLFVPSCEMIRNKPSKPRPGPLRPCASAGGIDPPRRSPHPQPHPRQSSSGNHPLLIRPAGSFARGIWRLLADRFLVARHHRNRLAPGAHSRSARSLETGLRPRRRDPGTDRPGHRAQEAEEDAVTRRSTNLHREGIMGEANGPVAREGPLQCEDS
jgi:hypothetical protein